MSIDLYKTVYYIENNKVHESTLSDYLEEFWADETTAPHGVSPRLHLRQGDDIKVPWHSDSLGQDQPCQVWTWGAQGNFPKKILDFDTVPEAVNYIYESWYEDSMNKSTDAPTLFPSKKEAEEFLKELMDED